MYGAILGDIVGSPYEFDSNNIKTKEFPLFGRYSAFTDDTVLTLAVAEGILCTPDRSDDAALAAGITAAMRRLGRAYPDAGYGLRFTGWLRADDPKPYHSCGNGSAMRVSPVAWAFDTLESVRRAARVSACITHDHPEGIKGAEAVASAIFLARTGSSKAEIRRYVEQQFGYDLSRTCDEIRPSYHHVETCQETVPQAFAAFFEGQGFEDVLRTAVSLGGDSDTLTAIAGSLAEGFYGVDEDWKKAAYSRLTADLAQILRRFDLAFGRFGGPDAGLVHRAVAFAERAHRGRKRKGTAVDYIVHPMEVLSILAGMNASPELQAAGVLHDTVEDAGVTAEQLRAAFGERVAALVAFHSEDKSKSWQERKRHAVASLRQAGREERLLVLADQVANLRSLLTDHIREGDALWARFNAGRRQQAWYYGETQNALADLEQDPDASRTYWEHVALYKDLFVTFWLDQTSETLYQIAGDWEGYVCARHDWKWVRWEGPIPDTAERIPRLKAELLDDLWFAECRAARQG